MTTATLEPPAATSLAPWAEAFERLRQERSGEPRFLAELRRHAFDRFLELGFPTTRQEEWRFTNVSALARTSFTPPAAGPAVRAAEADRFGWPGGIRLIFVDGRFAPALSTLEGLPAGLRVASLAEVLAREPERLEGRLGAWASFAEHPFVALSTAFFTDGAYLETARGAVIEEPVQLIFLTTAAPEPSAVFPRLLVVAGEASQLTLVETYASLGEGVTFTCAVTEVAAGAAAVVDHYKRQMESVSAYHLATLQFHQERASNLFSHSISTGGALVRNDVNAVLDGEGAECTLNGLYVLRGTQFLDNHMRVDHAKAHCNSFELFKGVLDERSRAVFNGRIFVAKGAQKTDAKQSSRNLLLSREALVNANPQLEIFADDVKCTHGSTVGQLDEDAIFYLRSRGIGEEAARSLLTYAFAADIVERLKVEPLRREVEEFLFHRLPKGEIVRQAV
ncbi:MAG TPA: Fe-S cluster assembly protein SufD [Thermoanaerobaculia bacterium]|nr:Fe-S cluster assembly protein SufD [Thermoanaerobaculia bacterium]